MNDIIEGTTVSPDEELERALAASRQVCPELCAAVEREIAKNGEINSASVDYEAIFQAIIRRHPSLLDDISITRRYSDTRYRYFDESFTLITANEIGSIYIEGGKIVSKIVPWKPEPCYIMSASEEGFYATPVENFVAKGTTFPQPEDTGIFASASSAPSAFQRKVNPGNGLAAKGWRTVGDSADGSRGTNGRIVRTK